MQCSSHPHPSIRLSSQVPQLPEARGLGNLTIDYLAVGGAQLVTIIDNFPLRYSQMILTIIDNIPIRSYTLLFCSFRVLWSTRAANGAKNDRALNKSQQPLNPHSDYLCLTSVIWQCGIEIHFSAFPYLSCLGSSAAAIF